MESLRSTPSIWFWKTNFPSNSVRDDRPPHAVCNTTKTKRHVRRNGMAQSVLQWPTASPAQERTEPPTWRTHEQPTVCKAWSRSTCVSHGSEVLLCLLQRQTTSAVKTKTTHISQPAYDILTSDVRQKKIMEQCRSMNTCHLFVGLQEIVFASA